jgi:hypothetical protein
MGRSSYRALSSVVGVSGAIVVSWRIGRYRPKGSNIKYGALLLYRAPSGVVGEYLSWYHGAFVVSGAI